MSEDEDYDDRGIFKHGPLGNPEDLDYHRDIKIDPDALDVEWLNQPEMMLDYSLALDEANKERDDLKLAIDKAKDAWTETKAKIALDIRRDPDQFELSKVTDSSVEAATVNDPRYIEAKNKYYDACEKYNEAKTTSSQLYSAVRAFEQKKEALEALVRLLGMQYFASPNVSRNLVEEYQKYRYKKEAATKKEVREKIKSRRSKP